MRFIVDTPKLRREILAGLIELPGVSRVTGISLTDDHLRWITLAPEHSGMRVVSHGTIALPSGAIKGGIIDDRASLVRVLSDARARFGTRDVHIALPDDISHLFHMPADVPQEVAEFEAARQLDVAPERLVVATDRAGNIAAVGVLPRVLVHDYRDAFAAAGLHASSLEVATRAAARTLASHIAPHRASMLVDISDHRATVTDIRDGLPVSSEVHEIGDYTDASAAKLAHIVAQRLRTMHARHMRDADQGTAPVTRVVLHGARATNALADAIARESRVPTELGDVWRSFAPADTQVPSIPREESSAYASAIGAALRACEARR